VHIVVDPAECRYGLQMLLDKYFPHLNPGSDYRPILPDEMARTTVYRLEIEHMSGKKNRGSADHPDAFFYGEQSA
jgi:nitroimidazol reductase NimA-like FMN-containing flavoprotein (pyridoxamine 5'-phosphate oxidase superfamily)